jgi:hypothetical protein
LLAVDIIGSLKLLSDQKAMQRWVKEITDYTASFNEAKLQADRAVAESRKEIAQHDAQRRAHAKKLTEAQQAFDDRCAAASKEIDARQAETKRLNDEARRDAEANAKLRADLQRRLDFIKQAGAL